MQLRLSLVAATFLVSSASMAEDYVSFQFLQYNENDNRTSVSAPSITINKDFGVDYTLNIGLVVDAVSGASPTYYYDGVSSATSVYYDSSSGASAYSRGLRVNIEDIKYANIEYSDLRKAPGALFTMRFDNRDELSIGANYSSEKDFYSTEGSAEYMHYLDASKNQSLSFGASYQSNEILVNCEQNSQCDAASGASEMMEASVINTQIGFSQNINKQSYIKLSFFGIYEEGYLSNPYYNVIRNNDGINADVVAERRPDVREAYGMQINYANALSTKLTGHISYRFYDDNWDISSHTLDSDLYYELSNHWIFGLGLRAYTQSEALFYSASTTFFTDQTYASSDERLSAFNAFTYKSNIDYSIDEDLSVNFSANVYDQSTGLQALYFMSGVKYKF